MKLYDIIIITNSDMKILFISLKVEIPFHTSVGVTTLALLVPFAMNAFRSQVKKSHINSYMFL